MAWNCTGAFRPACWNVFHGELGVHIELRSVVPSLKSKQTNKHIRTTIKTNEKRSYHSWAKMSAAQVCACAHCSAGEERAKQAEGGREESMPSHGPPRSNSFRLRRLLFTPTLDQPKIIWDLLFKPLKTLLMLWNTGKESPDTSLWNATSLFTCSLSQCRGESWPRESENPHGSLSPQRLQRWWPWPLEEPWLTSRSPCLNSPASKGTAYQISICALHRNRIIHIGKDSI